MAQATSERLRWAVDVLDVGPDDQEVRFVTAGLAQADLGDEIYDKVFAVHVAALHTPGDELDIVRRRLAPGGKLYVFSQAPGWSSLEDAERFGAELGEVLGEAGFDVDDAKGKDLGSGFAAAAIARAAG